VSYESESSVYAKPLTQHSGQFADILRRDLKHSGDFAGTLTLRDTQVLDFGNLRPSQSCTTSTSKVACSRDGFEVFGIYASSMKTLWATCAGKVFIVALMIYFKTLRDWANVSLIIKTVGQDWASRLTAIAIATVGNPSLPNPAPIVVDSIFRRSFPSVVPVYKRQGLPFNLADSAYRLWRNPCFLTAPAST